MTLKLMPDPSLAGAPCRGQGEKFYSGRSCREAKAICAECPVRERCLEVCLEEESQPGEKRWGVRGGMTAIERSREFGPAPGEVQHQLV